MHTKQYPIIAIYTEEELIGKNETYREVNALFEALMEEGAERSHGNEISLSTE